MKDRFVSQKDFELSPILIIIFWFCKKILKDIFVGYFVAKFKGYISFEDTVACPEWRADFVLKIKFLLNISPVLLKLF